MDTRTNFAAGQLRQYIEQIERLEEEIKALNSDKSEYYKAAKGEGFDPKIIRKVIAQRRRSASEREEEEALIDLYMSALSGTGFSDGGPQT